ncbi:unnamed protein product [Fusarium equiseti]|uniref:Nephrocystin 3-like N-terminal domain-containing protein n=1 Tax=Fusarium equiseti TaxID=61235 RepID=A0A8J2II73_FUSEQ|nr:unnamed protein product [Fusarium equiseti]
MSQPPMADHYSPPSLEGSKPDRKFGLIQVHPEPANCKATAKKTVDIIFMHGLDAESPKTWITWVREDDPYSGDVNWLSDDNMLPAVMPNARILTYDWNANYDKTASRHRFLGHADDLLRCIALDRKETKRRGIPLMFVASCFSGLLLAQALVRATERYLPCYNDNRETLDSIAGVAFLGTPFRGSWKTGNLVANLRVRVASEVAGEYNRELMEYLKPGTIDAPSPLDDLVQRFTEMIHHADFSFGKVCFYETRCTDFTPHLRKLPPSYASQLDKDGKGIVVEEDSACLQGVERIGLQNEGFRHLTSKLKEFQRKSEVKLSTRAKLHDRCLEALYFGGINYEPGRIREASATSCQWMTEHPIFSRWHREGHGIFWILGSPGSGKSTLMKYAIERDQKLDVDGSTKILFFYFHNQGKRLQHMAEGLLRGLLRQLLERSPGQMHSFSDKLDIDAPKGLYDSRWTTPYLARLFEESLSEVLDHVNIRIFVDALDECRVGEEEHGTQEIEELVQRFREVEERLRTKPYRLSICFACRHYPQLALLDRDPHIKTEWENGQAIEDYVHQELLRITGDDCLRSNLETEIVASANGNFLWANLVTSKTVRLHTRGFDVEEGIRSTPKEISEIYAGILRRLSRVASQMSRELFQWLCFAQESLPLRAFRFPLNINAQKSSCSSVSGLPDSLQNNTERRMERLIRTLSGGLAEVKGKGEHVLLIHKSVKDFLIKDGFRILDPEQDTHQKVLAKGHGLLLHSCLWWLTETHLSEVVQHSVDKFDPWIMTKGLTFDIVEYGDLAHVNRLVVNGEYDTRGMVDGLDSSTRELIRAAATQDGIVELFYDCTKARQKSIIPQVSKDWHISDEVFTCLVLCVYIYHSEPSFSIYLYSRQSWTNNALQTIDNGGSSKARSAIQEFCLRLKPAYAVVYNRILGIIYRAATLPISWVLGLLVSGYDNPLDVNSMCREYGLTPLMEASKKGAVDNIRALLKHETISVNAKCLLGETALHFAVYWRRMVVTELLIIHGADINIQDHEGETALMYATGHDQYDMMDLLLQNGAIIHFQDLKGLDAIEIASDRCLEGLYRFIIREVRRYKKETWESGQRGSQRLSGT